MRRRIVSAVALALCSCWLVAAAEFRGVRLPLAEARGRQPDLGRPQPPQAIEYRLTFPEAEHRVMQVEVTFPEVGRDPLQVRMSRSSPGRYALHDFAKNVYDLRATGREGAALTPARPDPYGWTISGHDGTARIAYRVFGDRIDGTYLAIDSTHAHINMPAALVWARGFEDRPVVVRFGERAGARWRVATQLFPTANPRTFTAPNLQYLMDSPAELSEFAWREVRIARQADEGGAAQTLRIALHGPSPEAAEKDADGFARDVEQIVREARAVFGELPAFETGTYTFLADYLPWASGDGMEHRNSTVLTSSATLASGGARAGLLGAVSHEFFHCWNVERIRPRGLEPFDFSRENMSGELWLAEGFTSYYGDLLLARAGFRSVEETARAFGGTIRAVTDSPGRHVRSAEEMSRFASFIDGVRWTDPTNASNTFISYYTWGSAIALGLDLTLRERSDGRVTLDDYMRLLWKTYGKPGGRAPGLVDVPYTTADARDRLADLTADPAFATQFFARYIQGHDVVDYAPLLARAGLVLRPVRPGRAWPGSLQLEYSAAGAKVLNLVAPGAPAYAAGIDRDDTILSLDGEALTSADRLDAVLDRHGPGSAVPVVFSRRGVRHTSSLVLGVSPGVEVVTAENAGQPLTPAQRAFRERWLGTRQPPRRLQR